MVNAGRARSRTFLVTGAASGIGLATAERLLAEGGSVVGTDLAAPPDLGPDFRFVAADVTDEAAIDAVLAAVPDRLDGVVHSAGVAGGGPVHLLDRAEWERVIAINLTGTFLVAKAALARMIEQPRVDGERGSIVTLASIEGLEGTAGGSVYNAAKGGVVMLTKNSRAMHAMLETCERRCLHPNFRRPDRQGARRRAPARRVQSPSEKASLESRENLSDNDISAYSGKRRPGFEEMLDAMKAGEIDALICWHVDRLYRNMKDLERFIEAVDQQHVEVRTVQSGTLDLSNASGKMMARILASVARQESEQAPSAASCSNVQRAAAGQWPAGRRPFGYATDGTPIEPEATAIRQAVTDVLAGKSGRRSARVECARATHRRQRESVAVDHSAARPDKPEIRGAGGASGQGRRTGPLEGAHRRGHPPRHRRLSIRPVPYGLRGIRAQISRLRCLRVRCLRRAAGDVLTGHR